MDEISWDESSGSESSVEPTPSCVSEITPRSLVPTGDARPYAVTDDSGAGSTSDAWMPDFRMRVTYDCPIPVDPPGSPRSTVVEVNPLRSWSAQRDMQIRAAFGVVDGSSRRRRRQLRKRRRMRHEAVFSQVLGNFYKPKPPCPTPCIETLPIELQSRILWNLPLQSMHNARLSGVLGSCPVGAESAREIFFCRRSYIAEVEPLLLRTKPIRHRFEPVTRKFHVAQYDETGRERPLSIAAIEEASLKTVETASGDFNELPPAVGEMRNLWRLSVQAGRLMFLPASIAFLTDLAYLDLTDNMFVQFPTVVLLLKNLQHLIIAKNELLEGLPGDLGECLPRLRHLDIRECPAITTLSDSLLARLNQRPLSSPLELSPDLFDRSYLCEKISWYTFPRLFEKFSVQYPELYDR